MKKTLAVIVSILMLFTCMLPAFAAEKTAEAGPAKDADAAAAARGDVAALDYEEIADIVLDWIDRRIAAEAAGFDKLEIEAFGQPIAVDLEVDSLEDLLQYADHLADLGGDFANLTNGLDEFKALKRADGNLRFIYGFIDFMAANADVLGKVFRWDEEQFDLGKVGAFIEGSEDLDPEIKDLYNWYVAGKTNEAGETFDIRNSFVSEIAREMGYDWDGEEAFDDVINNGVKAKFLEIFGDLLSDASRAAILDDAQFDLRTTDVYTLVEQFVGLLQNDYKDKLDEMLASFLSALQGMAKIVTAAVNVEPPVVEIGDKNTVVGTYHPASVNAEDYMPVVYMPEAYVSIMNEALGGDSPVTVKTDAELPADLVKENETAMQDEFKMTVKGRVGEQAIDETIEITFAAIQEMIDAAAAQIVEQNEMINSIDVALAYTSYSNDNQFVTEVSIASATASVTFMGFTMDVDLLDPPSSVAGVVNAATASLLKDPIATIVVDNLNGEIEELAQLQELVALIDPDAAYDNDLLDVAANYEEYKGAIGQLNRILYGAVDMIASDAGMADLGLAPGGNENLHENLQKICDKVSGLLDLMKAYIPRDQFIALAGSADISAAFASSHGFNAGMIYDMDFSSVENALVCGIRMGCDLLVEDDPDSILYDFHLRVEDLETLDAMAAAAADMLFAKVVNAIDPDYAYAPIDYANVAENGARDAIFGKADELLFHFADKCVALANKTANSLIAELNDKADLGLVEAAFTLGVEYTGDWETDFEALIDRFIALTDGLCIPAGAAKEQTGLWTKATTIADAVLPMTSMFSNYDGLEKLHADFFDKALDGDADDFLAYFETKDDAIASGVSVNKALINASDYIVDAFFPDTVEAQLYADAPTVQQTFTGSESDNGIAARNMVSIAARKTHVVPALLDLLREAGLLPSLACAHEWTELAYQAPTCEEAGHTAGKVCAVCGMTNGAQTLEPIGHAWGAWTVTTAATCVKAGVETRVCANDASHTETREIAATGVHSYENGVCTMCGAAEPGAAEPGEDDGGEPSGFAAFWQKIVNFFNRIRDFFRKLFGR